MPSAVRPFPSRYAAGRKETSRTCFESRESLRKYAVFAWQGQDGYATYAFPPQKPQAKREAPASLQFRFLPEKTLPTRKRHIKERRRFEGSARSVRLSSHVAAILGCH